MDWSAIVGAISAAVVLAIGAAVKAWQDMRKGRVEVQAAEQAVERAARGDAVEEWKDVVGERDVRIGRLETEVRQLRQDLDRERDRSAECERRAAILNDRFRTVVHACRNKGMAIPEWDDFPPPGSAPHPALPPGGKS